MGVKKRNGQTGPKGVAVEVCDLQIVPRAFERLTIERRPRIVSAVERSALFVLNGNSASREEKAPILTNEMRYEALEAQGKFDANVFQNVRPSFDLPQGAAYRHTRG